MSADPPKVLVTRRLPDAVEERMQALFSVTRNPADTRFAPAALIAAAKGHDVLVPTINDTLDAEVIAALPDSIRLIAQFGNGVDNIDMEATRKRGIVVTNTPSVLTEDTADMTMALILSGPRRLVEGAQVLPREGSWEGWAPTWILGRRLGGKALGIVGMGRIGMAVARRARAFGLAIHYYTRTRRPAQVEEQLAATYWPSLEDMLGAVDIVSLHTPHTHESYNLLNDERLRCMKRDAYLVNISRPELIDEAALVDLVESGHLGGAALDVFASRDGINPRLLALAKQNRIVLTPHMASATLEGRIEMGETVIVNIRVFWDGDNPPHRVLPEMSRN